MPSVPLCSMRWKKKSGSLSKKVKSRCYREHKDGFYVYARPNKCDPHNRCQIHRALPWTPCDCHRLASITSDWRYGYFLHYNRHEDDAYVEETIPVMEFIERLIQHIPEKHYKMIRYGGLYARHRDIDKKPAPRHIPGKAPYCTGALDQWRTAILSSFGYDPLKCECGTTMLFLELYFNHKRVSLEEMYKKVMSRSRGKSSSA